MQNVLGEQADELARQTGFIKRERKFSGSSFVQSLVFGWLGNEAASLNELKQVAQAVGVGVSRQGLDQRFTEESALFMEQMLGATMRTVIEGHPQQIEALNVFGKIYVVDSTVITLPDALADQWLGITGSGLKLSVVWDVQKGSLPLLHKQPAREHDTHAPFPLNQLGPGDLWLGDLGYFKLDRFQTLSDQGTFWLSRYKTGTNLSYPDGRAFDLATYLADLPADAPQEVDVLMGQDHQLPVRLVVQPITDPASLARRQKKLKNYERKKQTTASDQRHQLCDYDVFVTTIPLALASTALILELARVRWQIELLFKLWKSELQVDEWRTTQPWRILCEIYAKLMAAIIQHWLFLMGDVHHFEASLTLARQVIRHYSWSMARYLFDTHTLVGCLVSLKHALQTCRTHSSPTRLTTFKRLTS
jgi:hypothetical protein